MNTDFDTAKSSRQFFLFTMNIATEPTTVVDSPPVVNTGQKVAIVNH
jgi:hypothetical protein